MTTIKDYMDKYRDEDVPIRIWLPEDPEDSCCAAGEDLFEGLLADVPEDLQGMEVTEVGRSLVTGYNVLTVSGPELGVDLEDEPEI